MALPCLICSLFKSTLACGSEQSDGGWHRPSASHSSIAWRSLDLDLANQVYRFFIASCLDDMKKAVSPWSCVVWNHLQAGEFSFLELFLKGQAQCQPRQVAPNSDTDLFVRSNFYSSEHHDLHAHHGLINLCNRARLQKETRHIIFGWVACYSQTLLGEMSPYRLVVW
jgi:hypothetical protein